MTRAGDKLYADPPEPEGPPVWRRPGCWLLLLAIAGIVYALS